MDRLQEPLHRQLTILAPLLPLTEIAMVTRLVPQPVLQITLAIRLPLIVTGMDIRQERASRIRTTLVIPGQTTMILMVTLQVLLIVALTISELQEPLIRIREVTPGDRQHHQQTTLVPRQQITTATTRMTTSGRGKS